MNFVGLGDITTSFEVWMYVFPKGRKALIWLMVFIAAVRVISRMRN